MPTNASPLQPNQTSQLGELTRGVLGQSRLPTASRPHHPRPSTGRGKGRGVSMPTDASPLQPNRTSQLGQQTRGGLGKPLGRGEGWDHTTGQELATTTCQLG